MRSSIVARYRQDLEAQINGQELNDRLQQLTHGHEVLRKYPDIEGLVKLVQAGNRNYADKDAVLVVLLGEIKQSRILFPLLNFMFWDSLLKLYHQRCRAVPDPDELFLRVQADFFHTAVEYPLERRPHKIDVNLILDTKKKLVQWQKDESRFSTARVEFAPWHERETPLEEFMRSDVFPEEMGAFLLDLVYRRVINEQQCDLILQVDVYKRMTQKEWAAARGVPHATARSWHFRAAQAIREYIATNKEKSA